MRAMATRTPRRETLRKIVVATVIVRDWNVLWVGWGGMGRGGEGRGGEGRGGEGRGGEGRGGEGRGGEGRGGGVIIVE